MKKSKSSHLVIIKWIIIWANQKLIYSNSSFNQLTQANSLGYLLVANVLIIF